MTYSVINLWNFRDVIFLRGFIIKIFLQFVPSFIYQDDILAFSMVKMIVLCVVEHLVTTDPLAERLLLPFMLLDCLDLID